MGLAFRPVAIVALLSLLVVVCLRRKQVSTVKQDLKQDLVEHSRCGTETAYPEELIREQLARNYAFLGEQGQTKLRESFVIVVGLGGVGSHAAHMLARAGVKHLHLIDFDQLTLSSLNRHALGKLADVGLPKTIVMQRHLSQIVPFSTIQISTALLSADNADLLLAGQPDFVLDCIDNISTKVHLIKHCLVNKIPIISSMGASGKADPSRIVIGDISESSEDPLARKCRQMLKGEIRDGARFKCVYSLEKECTFGLIDNPETIERERMNGSGEGSQMTAGQESNSERQKANADYAPLPNFRSRTLPVLGPIPALFGNIMATHVITELSFFHTDPLTNKLRQTTYLKMYQEFLLTLQSLTPPERCTISLADVAFVYEEVWRARSPISGNPERMKLCKWDNAKDATLYNLVCFGKKEAIRHKSVAIEDVRRVYGNEIVDLIDERFAVMRQWDHSRKTQL